MGACAKKQEMVGPSDNRVLICGKKKKLEMLADFLREASVLILVFVPLDMYTHKGFSALRALEVLVASGLVLGFGIGLERRRP